MTDSLEQPSLAALLQRPLPLPETSLARLLEMVENVHLPKGTVLFTDNHVGRYLYFIQRGLARAYVRQGHREVTFWFGCEGAILLSIQGYVAQQISYEVVELLEDSQLVRLPTEALQQCYADDVHLANWGRTIAEQEWVRTEQQLIARQFRSATERYAELQQQRPAWLSRVSLGQIASYLGITQVTLSRVRAGSL